ncbi:MAG: DoxX family protein [Chloroflexi bacterium]|nr:MAG: DoxX family protein [Chloroflexota bacterium]MBL1195642.1 DoxX family protein [Chloroflexota bacterium]NOH12930.1 DoxX family protein [Chloroflexota bacterium]
MNIVLWIVQGLAALLFLMAGVMKLTRSKEQLSEQMSWVEDFSQGQVRLIGTVEFLGALGLVLPMVMGILPILTPIAAAGLALVMLGAVYTHLRRSENAMLMRPLIPLILVAFVAIGRFTF